MAAATPTRPPPPTLEDDCALFLDVDGTLLDFAPDPASVAVPPPLREVLQALARRLDGAVALVSGRPLATLDALFAPLKLPVAGMHGLERRNGGRKSKPPRAPDALQRVRGEAETLSGRHPGTVVEDKGTALGLHWRRAPQHGPALRAFAEAALPRLPGYRLQHGDHVVELRPVGADKGDAIAAFLGEPPFRGRRPVFVGDDLTDEHGFAVVNARDGWSVLVGDRQPSAAHYALRDTAAVHAWLHSNHRTPTA
ncbi:trehalose-phosphatase [Luteimonas sp. RD2P54]|uniref:Trehalose 6-phosphate phosphatase n=1 Tax=Luteimonas endophytica TaxID=3042023 RepID=A0ABT6J6A9_9GAMM|nr:trehalose-phosphatase [Luteimonas endophytica]MDH5822304.1 trehalose-phosphatase [Luteimonas endophytica]